MPESERLIILADTREQKPYRFRRFNTGFVPYTLKTGDYSVLGAEDFIIVERKSLQDFLQCIGGARKRFYGEVFRLGRIAHAAIVVETNFDRAVSTDKNRYTKLAPGHVYGAVAAIVARLRVPVFFSCTRKHGEEFTYRFLKAAYYKLRTYGGWLSEYRERTVRLCVCILCGVTKHETIDRLQEWRTAYARDGVSEPCSICPDCQGARAPKGYRWSKYGGKRVDRTEGAHK